MNHTRDCIAIVVTTSGERRSTLGGAESAHELTLAKVASQQELVRPTRLAAARNLLSVGMRLLFHQGGGARYANRVDDVGCLVAAGYLESVADLEQESQVDGKLLVRTLRTFSGNELVGMLRFRQVRTLSARPATKSLIERSPRRGEHYIIVKPHDPRFAALEAVWKAGYEG